MKINVNGYEIAYQITGQGEDTVVILQGWGTEFATYNSVAACISDRYRVVQFDFPGFGASDEPREPWAVEDYANFFLDLMAALGIQKATLLGHSYGGRVIIRLAARESLPFTIERIVLVDSAGILPKKTWKQKMKIRRYKMLKKIVNLKLVYAICPRLIDEWKNSQGSADYRNASPMMRQCLVKAVNEDLTDLLPKIQQDTLLIILNSPGQNPTGYRLTDDEWKSVIAVLSALPSSKKIALVADTAYIDFAGDEDDVRTFLPLFDTLPDNVMALLAYSFSKTFTLYGMRCGALIGLAPDERTAEEFSRVTEYSGRASWSNCARAGQAIIEHIYEDPALLERVTAERTEIRNMLLARGAAFGEEASKCGLDMLPYNGGFFAVVPCENAKEVGLKLEKEAHAFTIPFGDGLRVSLAAMPMTQCRILPQKMKDVLSSMEYVH